LVAELVLHTSLQELSPPAHSYRRRNHQDPLVEQEAFAHYQYKAAKKKKFRRFMDKPARRFRRRIKSYKKKKFGHGSGTEDSSRGVLSRLVEIEANSTNQYNSRQKNSQSSTAALTRAREKEKEEREVIEGLTSTKHLLQPAKASVGRALSIPQPANQASATTVVRPITS
jgi:hypothetical protein